MPTAASENETMEREKKRVEVGDAIAIFNLGTAYSSGIRDYPQEHAKGLKLWHQAGEFGLAAAN